MDISQFRREYLKGGLSRSNLNGDPILQFAEWFDQARKTEIADPTAMTLATVREDGQPSQRTVLLKYYDEKGFVFFTNFESRKAKELEANAKVPWDDLRYLFGEIMYGGHIVDDWDRIFCSAYLDNLMSDALLDEAELFPFIEGKGITFKSPPNNLSYEKYIEYIEIDTPSETPLMFGMHPNAEIDFRTKNTD